RRSMTVSVEVTTPSDREIRLVRVFKAPAQRVFDAHTRVEHVQKWLLGPPGWTMPVCEIDLRVGGGFRYRWRNGESGAEFEISGVFREIVAPERIVHSERMHGVPGIPEGPDGEVVATSTYVERDGRTTLTMTLLYASREARDGALQSGMTKGV